MRSSAETPTRRRLPQEPRSRTGLAQQEPRIEEPGHTGHSWIKTKVFDSIKDTVNSASAGISALAHRFDQTINNVSTEGTRPADVDQNHNNAQIKNYNEQVVRRVRSRRFSDLSQPELNSAVNPAPTSIVQEKSRMFAKRANTSDNVCANRGGLRSAQSMDALYKPPAALTSGRVRDRLSSFETGNTAGSKTRNTRSSSPTISPHSTNKEGLTRTRSRAGSEVSLAYSHESDTSSHKVDGSIVPRNTKERDKEALLHRDYRDVLKKLSRSRAGSTNNLTIR